MTDSFCIKLKDACEQLNSTGSGCYGVSLDKINKLVNSMSSVERSEHVGDPFFWLGSILFGVAIGITGSFLYHKIVKIANTPCRNYA